MLNTGNYVKIQYTKNQSKFKPRDCIISQYLTTSDMHKVIYRYFINLYKIVS